VTDLDQARRPVVADVRASLTAFSGLRCSASTAPTRWQDPHCPTATTEPDPHGFLRDMLDRPRTGRIRSFHGDRQDLGSRRLAVQRGVVAVSGQDGSVNEPQDGRTHEFLAGVDQRARRLLDAPGAEYEVGIDLMGYSVPYVESVEPAGGLYLVWGAWTDRIDGPTGDEPGVEESAIADMRRAASEWLATPRTGTALRVYLDRWVYDECGYAR